MYPTVNDPTYGIFVKEQIESLQSLYPEIEVEVLFIEGYKNKFNYIKSIPLINKRIKNGEFDLIHIHYGLSGLYLMNPFNDKKPTVITLHGGDIFPEQGKKIQVALTKWIIRKADTVITLNDRMSEIVSPLCKRHFQLPCGINTRLFKPSETHKATRSGKLKLVFPSSPSRSVKNYRLFCDTINRLREKTDREIETICIEKMNRHQVAETLRNSDLLLMTSISEGSPQIIKEAMASGLPIVSTDVGDVGKITLGVENCMIASEPTPESLSESVRSVLSGEIAGEKGTKRIVDLNLDETSVSKKLMEIYCKTLEHEKKNTNSEYRY